MRAAALTSGFHFPDLPANWKFLYGITGLVAEEVMSYKMDAAGAIADAVRYRISNGEASETDLTAMGITHIDDYHFNDEFVEESLRFLQEVWLDKKKEAKRHIELLATDTSRTRQ